jgi:hypothetical protein
VDESQADVLRHYFMLEVYSTFKIPQWRRGFRSVRHLAKVVTGSPNPSSFSIKVCHDMLDKKLLVFTSDDKIGLDESAFEGYIEGTSFGTRILSYADDVSVIRVPSNR